MLGLILLSFLILLICLLWEIMCFASFLKQLYHFFLIEFKGRCCRLSLLLLFQIWLLWPEMGVRELQQGQYRMNGRVDFYNCAIYHYVQQQNLKGCECSFGLPPMWFVTVVFQLELKRFEFSHKPWIIVVGW